MSEFLGFVKSQSIDGRNADLRELSDEWRRANAHIKELEGLEKGLADNPPTLPIPGTMANEAIQLQQDPIFQKAFFATPVGLGVVELDRLVVFQKEINLAFVSQLRERLGSHPSPGDLFRFCLPYDHPQPPVRHFQIAPNAYAFVSPSNDLRVLEASGFDGNPLIGYSPSGPVAGVFAFVVGYGSNFLNVVSAENRMILNNGSHRAYALREAGIRHAPCIVQKVTTREELETVSSGDVPARAEYFLKSARPPLLKDYFDPKLRKILKMPRKVRQVRITFGVEGVDLPGA